MEIIQLFPKRHFYITEITADDLFWGFTVIFCQVIFLMEVPTLFPIHFFYFYIK